MSAPSERCVRYPIFEMMMNMNSDSVEILVHNVSHTDLLIALDDPIASSIIARPKFSCFREISETIKRKISHLPVIALKTMMHPVYSRERDYNVRHPISKNSDTSHSIDVGIDLTCHSVIVSNIQQLRFRQNDAAKLPNHAEPKLAAVYFPLLALLIPKWLMEIEFRGKSNCRKIIYLISGQGTPRDEKARIQDNSTQITAELMKIFLRKVYPELEVVLIHSPSFNLFLYRDNIVFVNTILLPKINSERNDLAARIGAKWLESFHVTMSFADGASARISAINAALKSYR